MPSAEKPTATRESFNQNEQAIEEAKRAIAGAAAEGDYDKVVELAQAAKGMEGAKNEMVDSAHSEATGMNRGIDETAAYEEKAAREAALAEAAHQDTTASSVEAAALLEKMQGGNAESPEQSGINSAEVGKLSESLMDLFSSAGWSSWEEKIKDIGSIEAAIENLDQRSQEALGQEFFDQTIGKNIANIPKAYKVYEALSKSGFTEKFHNLEDARLKSAGYSGFSL